MTRAIAKKENENSILSRAERSRQRIKRAARQVFAKHPYHIATIRMVAQAGGFDHQLITYHFNTKAELFEEMMAEIIEEFNMANLNWLVDLNQMSVEEGFSLWIDRMLEYHFTKPEAVRILALNAPLIERLDEAPGFKLIPESRARFRAFFEQITGTKDNPDYDRFVITLDFAIVNYLGSAPTIAQALGMDPNSDEYKAWVKQTFIYSFFPQLQNLLSPYL